MLAIAMGILSPSLSAQLILFIGAMVATPLFLSIDFSSLTFSPLFIGAMVATRAQVIR